MSKKLGASIGLVIVVMSIVLVPVFANPYPCLVGFILAFISLFFKGYRSIFLGYIISLGLLFLVVIIYCANHPIN